MSRYLMTDISYFTVILAVNYQAMIVLKRPISPPQHKVLKAETKFTKIKVKHNEGSIKATLNQRCHSHQMRACCELSL